MDIYQIMARLDAIGSKKNLTESQDMMQPVAEGHFKELDIILQDYPEDVEEFKQTGELSSDLYDALFGFYEDQMDYGTAKARTGDPYNFIADKLSDALGLDEAYEKLPPEELGLDKFSQAALAGGQRKRDALANPNQTRMLAKKSAQQRPVREAGEAFAKGDRVMYLNGFATVVSQDGDAYVVKVDGQPNTMKVPATAIKKPSYNEGVSKSKKAKPDFLDMDKDGNKKESFKKAVQDKKVAESAKPDFLDLDKDGNKKEPMKKAAKDKNDAKGSFQKQMGGSAKDLTKGLSIGAKKVSEQLDEVFPGTPEYELRFGKDDASSAFDKKKISTGTVYSRKHHEEPEAADDDDTPKKKGRPVGAKRRLGAKGPGVDSKLLKGKGGLKEGDIDIVDRGEYDREGDMALSQVHQIADAARELHAILASDDNLPEWVQSKITKALDYIDTARDYLGAEGEMDREELPEIAPIVGALAGRALAGAAGAGSTGQAIGSLAGRAVAGAMNGNDEVEEAGYSAKSARAGKDIGKPGKNFSKIAKGAAERYGSKEAGERVAGAVLKKLRAKEGVEEGSADKKDVPFDGPYRKKGDDKDQFGNKIKHAARHAARPGLADMTTAELKAELKRRSQVEEESTDTQDQHAEKAGKKVTKDLEYDMKHKGKDDAKAEKAGKKVTKDIEYDDKKDKEKKVDETTVSGSVATGGDAPKKSKGGMQFGQGVYEGAIAESFDKKLGGILTEGMSVNVSTDDTGKKSITVNATDADADSLGNMLKMAGLFSSEGYSRTCEHCHGIHEAGACQAEQVAEELANSPDEVYADKDYMTQTLSGGLNGPKTTGQTTGPVVNRQDSRQGVMAEAERVVEQSESRLWNLYKQYEKK
jgi:hypothetical protein